MQIQSRQLTADHSQYVNHAVQHDLARYRRPVAEFAARNAVDYLRLAGRRHGERADRPIWQ